MRKRLAVAVALAVSMAAAMSPAYSEPASSSSASAYGLSATILGSQVVAPTPVVSAAQPPDTNSGPAAIVPVTVGTLAVSATGGVEARAHQADDIPAVLVNPLAPGILGDTTTVTPVNAWGFAKTEGLAVLLSDETSALDSISTLLSTTEGLISADEVTAEAVAKCVDNQPVFETGFLITNLGGLVGTPLDPIVDAVLLLAIELLGGLEAIISIETGRVTQTATSVAIDALVITVPLLNTEIIVSHAEAQMPANCGIAPPPTVQPTGPGPIAQVGTLAATGSDIPFVPLGVLLLGSAFVLRRVVRQRLQSGN